MKVAINMPRIRFRKMKISIKNYILFSMFSTPFIDLINGYFGGGVPIGQIIRTVIVFVNIYLCTKCIPRTEKKSTYIFLFIVIYVVAHSAFAGILSNTGGIMDSFNFGLKLLLFLSEMQMLVNYSRKGIIRKENFVDFWKFSCWFVPISLLVCKFFNLRNTANNSNSGLYSSVNAMSIIFIIQFVLSMYFAKEEKRYWITTLLNLVAMALLGTKSPYLYVGAVVIALALFYSKHRIRTITTIITAGVLAYFLISKYFSDDMLRYIEYHTYHLNNALESNTIWGYLFSGRNNMLLAEWRSILSNGLSTICLTFGIGRSNFVSGIEMDFFEILFSFGIFVTIGVYYLTLRSFSWKSKNRIENLFLNLALICMVSFGTLGGHTFLEAISATYSAILIGYKFSCYLDGRNV